MYYIKHYGFICKHTCALFSKVTGKWCGGNAGLKPNKDLFISKICVVNIKTRYYEVINDINLIHSVNDILKKYFAKMRNSEERILVTKCIILFRCLVLKSKIILCLLPYA